MWLAKGCIKLLKPHLIISIYVLSKSHKHLKIYVQYYNTTHDVVGTRRIRAAMAIAMQGRSQDFRKGGAKIMRLRAKYAKFFCDQKPHLLINFEHSDVTFEPIELEDKARAARSKVC